MTKTQLRYYTKPRCIGLFIFGFFRVCRSLGWDETAKSVRLVSEFWRSVSAALLGKLRISISSFCFYVLLTFHQHHAYRSLWKTSYVTRLREPDIPHLVVHELQLTRWPINRRHSPSTTVTKHFSFEYVFFAPRNLRSLLIPRFKLNSTLCMMTIFTEWKLFFGGPFCLAISVTDPVLVDWRFLVKWRMLVQ